jgi:hypothetical protein
MEIDGHRFQPFSQEMSIPQCATEHPPLGTHEFPLVAAFIPPPVAPLLIFQQQQTQLEVLPVQLHPLIPTVALSLTTHGLPHHHTIPLRIMQQQVLQLAMDLIQFATSFYLVSNRLFFLVRSSHSCHGRKALRHFLKELGQHHSRYQLAASSLQLRV